MLRDHLAHAPTCSLDLGCAKAPLLYLERPRRNCTNHIVRHFLLVASRTRRNGTDLLFRNLSNSARSLGLSVEAALRHSHGSQHLALVGTFQTYYLTCVKVGMTPEPYLTSTKHETSHRDCAEVSCKIERSCATEVLTAASRATERAEKNLLTELTLKDPTFTSIDHLLSKYFAA